MPKHHPTCKVPKISYNILTIMGKDTTVAIVGDGNAAHVLIPFLGGTHHTVNLLSLNPHKWDRTVRCEVQNMKHEVLKVRNI